MNLATPVPQPTVARRMVYAGAVLVVTLAAWGWALYTRHLSERPPLSWREVQPLIIDPIALARSLQTLIVPLLLVFLWSRSSLFRRLVGGESRPRDTTRLVGTLAALQLVALVYGLWLVNPPLDQATFGLLIVIVGGLVGGPRAGFWLGLFSTLVASAAWFLWDTQGHPWSTLMAWPEALRYSPLMLLATVFQAYYLSNLRSLMALWGGVVAGLCAPLLGERRFAPAVAVGLGAAIQAGAALFTVFTVERSADYAMLIPASVLTMGLALGIVALIVHEVQADGARRRAERAELARARAELRALRAQINPHFLFNALNTIRYAVRTDPEAARRLLLDLSEVFQRALRSGETVPLRDELSYVEAYLSLEKARLGERLKVVWSGVLQPDGPLQTRSPLMEIPVPTLALQPIVENAVVHGIAQKPEGGTVTITVTETDRDLLLRVEDDGAGASSSRLADCLRGEEGPNSSIGLSNVAKRLRALYGEAHRLSVYSEVGRGTRVEIRIPLGR